MRTVVAKIIRTLGRPEKLSSLSFLSLLHIPLMLQMLAYQMVMYYEYIVAFNVN